MGRKLIRKAYSYYRIVGSYLRRVPGKKRRQRVKLVRRIDVPAKYEETPKKKAPPKPKQFWENVAEYQDRIEQEKSSEGFDVTEREMEIYHLDLAADWIHHPSLFVWPIRKLPYSIPLIEKKANRKTIFKMIRIWFWVFHTDQEEYKLWSRTSTIPLAEFESLPQIAVDFYRAIQTELQDHFDYLEIRGFVAWTAYTLGEKAKKASNRIGGSDE